MNELTDPIYLEKLQAALDILHDLEQGGRSELLKYIAKNEGVDEELFAETDRLKRKTLNRMLSMPITSRTTFRKGMVSG